VCGRCDPRIAQLKPIVGAPAFRLGSKSGIVQGPVEKVAGTISGKHASSTVSTMSSGSQSKNKQAGVRITKRRYRFPPIIPVDVCAPFYGGNGFAMPDQPRTSLAFDDCMVQHDKVLFITFLDLNREWHRFL
jgi:hypothetical protein